MEIAKNASKHHTLLTQKDRDRIERWNTEGVLPTQIAQRLAVHRSTISRELKRNKDSQNNYRAVYAQKKAVKRISSRSKCKLKVFKNSELLTFIHTHLKLTWSPTQIATMLKEAYTDTSMHLSHEAIYQYIYILPKGGLKKELIQGLRQKRAYRYTQRQKREHEETRGKIQGMLSIHERPAEVADRTMPGHWEGDLIIGKYKRSAIATLVERTTRYVKLVPLHEGKDALSVRKALQGALGALPTHLTKTLTYDQGKEMSQHKQFTIDTGIQVYFADPASPWQRGTNENTNGLIRQFFPKGTDFSIVSDAELQHAEDLLNGRPRQCLGFAFPRDKFYDLVALER
jgi:transposase, IS30 family